MNEKPTKKHLGLRLRIRCHCGCRPPCENEGRLRQIGPRWSDLSFDAGNGEGFHIERRHCEVLETLSAEAP